MLIHPAAEEIALYTDLGSRCKNVSQIENHLRQCKTCLKEVVAARNLRDLEEAGLLNPEADRTIQIRPESRLGDYLKKQSARKKEAGSLAIGLSTLAGLLTSGLGSPTGSPIFASSGHSAVGQSLPEKDDVPVRNTDDDPSLITSEVKTSSMENSREHREMTNVAEIIRPNPVIGTPGQDLSQFPGQQSYQDTCAIRCQEFIIRQYTGVHLPEEYYIDESKAHGWYSEGTGTPMRNVGNLLEIHNIPVHRYMNANVFNLTAELAQGHKVIIGVDSENLRTTHPMISEIRHALGLAKPDHAVVVSGIDTCDPNNTKVIISDPGTGEVAARYPLDQFINAWKESHFFMVATQDPPPQSLQLPEMQNFNYQFGHLDHVGAMPYADFQQLFHEYQIRFAGTDYFKATDVYDQHVPFSQTFRDRIEHMLTLMKSHETETIHSVNVESIRLTEDHGDAPDHTPLIWQHHTATDHSNETDSPHEEHHGEIERSNNEFDADHRNQSEDSDDDYSDDHHDV